MADQNWPSMVTTIRILTGMATGVFGSAMGGANFLHSRRMKSFDLATTLRIAKSDLTAQAAALEPLLASVLESRPAVAATEGWCGSELMQRFQQQHEQDLVEARALQSRAQNLSAEANPEALTLIQVLLVTTHELQRQASGIKRRYEASVAEGDKARDRIKAAIDRRLP